MAIVDISPCNPYMILSRMQSDNDYFLNHPHIKHLWACNVTDQIDTMKSIWKNLTDKPEWLSWQEILDYEKKMIELQSSLNKEMFINGLVETI